MKFRAKLMLFAAAAIAAVPVTANAHEETATLRDVGATARGAIGVRSLSAPGRNTIYSCTHSQMGQALDRPWVDADGTIRFADKPVIEGAVAWPHFMEISRTLESLVIASNGLPSHMTGTYPVSPTSDAARFDRNPNSISEQDLRYTIPVAPQLADQVSCLPMGTIGIALTGGVFFNALDAPGRDAVANEVFDLCEGHPQRRGLYHYHHASPCFEQGLDDRHSPLVGYALDGFGIYGLRGEAGVLLTNDDLDDCHGHIGLAPDAEVGNDPVYHYHLTEAFPYTLGCFRGTVEARYLQAGPGAGVGPGGGPNRGPGGRFGAAPGRRPF